MGRSVWMLALTALMACDGGGTDSTGGDDTDATDDTDGGGSVENDLSLTEEATGDWSCFTPGTDFASTTWLTQTLDPAKVTTLSLAGQVLDFEEDTPRTDVEVRLWYDDDATGAPDAATQADEDGQVSLDGPSCTPMSYLAYPDPLLGEAKPTYKAHQVYGYQESGDFDAEYISVSTNTYLVVPAIVGITPDPTKSVIAGTAFDCTRSPDTLSDVEAGKVQNVEVVVRDLDGNKVEGVYVRYFVEKFPDRDQQHTSADGLWTAINVPPGTFRLEMWGLIGGEERILGSTILQTQADSINIANIFGGYSGVKYPDGCVATE